MCMLYLLSYFFCSCDLKRLMLTAEAGQMATKVALSSGNVHVTYTYMYLCQMHEASYLYHARV